MDDELVQSIDVGMGIPPPEGEPESPSFESEKRLPQLPSPSVPPLPSLDQPAIAAPPKWAEGQEDWITTGPLMESEDEAPQKQPSVPLDTASLPVYERPVSQQFDEPDLPEAALVPGLPSPEMDESEFVAPDDVSLGPEQVRERAWRVGAARREETRERRRRAHGFPPRAPSAPQPSPETPEAEEEPAPQPPQTPREWLAGVREGAGEDRQIPNIEEARRAVATAGDPWGGPSMDAYAEGARPAQGMGEGGRDSTSILQQMLEELRELNQAVREQTEALSQLAEVIPSLGAVGT